MCVNLNYYPKFFKKVYTVITKKPLNKGISYKNLKIYRPITLLSYTREGSRDLFYKDHYVYS